MTMVKADVISLIAEVPAAHGVFDTVTKTARTVYCTVRSVGRTEMYHAMSAGLQPEYIFELAHFFEYQGEKLVEYQGVEYRVIRTYVTDTDTIEITVERSNHHV